MTNFYTLAGKFDLTPSQAFHADSVIVWLVCAIVLFALFALAAIYAFLPHARRAKKEVNHIEPRSTFSVQVRDVEKAYNAGKMDKQKAYHELASIARNFASSRLGKDVTAHTLAELRQSGQHNGLILLKTTIEGLYPPEFAYEATQPESTKASVHQACQWVLALIERWDA